MPYLSFYNLDADQVQKISQAILADLAKVIDRPTDVCFFSSYGAEAIINNEVRKDACYVKIEWMPRPEEMEVAVAKLVEDQLRKLGFNETTIYFCDIDKTKYYKNGERP